MAKYKAPQAGGGLLGSKAGKTILNTAVGYATGGPVGAGLGAVQGLAGDAPAGKIAGIASTARALGANPMERRLAQTTPQPDPTSVLSEAWEALKDPMVPQEVKVAYGEPILRAKLFGARRIG